MVTFIKSFRKDDKRIYVLIIFGIVMVIYVLQISGKCDNLQCQIAANTPDKPAEIRYRDNIIPWRLDNITVSGSGDYVPLNRFNKNQWYI